MHTVESVAKRFDLLPTLHRAFSFHTKLESQAWTVLRIPVEYDGALARTAGKFFSEPLLITLHPALDGPKAARYEHVETFLHELAHAHQWLVHGIIDHGATWWEAMHQLGQIPRRTHNIAACQRATDSTSLTIDDIGL